MRNKRFNCTGSSYGITVVWIKTLEARHHLGEIGSIEIDNIKIELFTTCPNMIPFPNEFLFSKPYSDLGTLFRYITISQQTKWDNCEVRGDHGTF